MEISARHVLFAPAHVALLTVTMVVNFSHFSHRSIDCSVERIFISSPKCKLNELGVIIQIVVSHWHILPAKRRRFNGILVFCDSMAHIIFGRLTLRLVNGVMPYSLLLSFVCRFAFWVRVVCLMQDLCRNELILFSEQQNASGHVENWL